jgi:hypothetical protein
MAGKKKLAKAAINIIKRRKKRKPQPDRKKSYEAEGARKSPDTGGSVNVSRQLDQDIIDKRTKVNTPRDEINFLKLQQTESGRKRGAAKAKLQRIINNEDLPKSQRDKAKKTLTKMRKEDEVADVRRRAKQSQTQRRGRPVSLAGLKKTEKPTKISFVDEQTGEVFEVSRSKYEGMTINERNAMLRNFKARSRLGEDLSDKGMAKQRKKLAAAKASRKAYGGKTVKKQMGGNMGSKPKGVGCAQRGYGKAMK